MPRDLRQYLIFIGSPGGLEAERRLFAARIEHYNKHHGEPDGILFKPIGWEDTLPGNGRPQELINEDLKRCDYAIFLFHTRWGSVAGPSGKVGTEEEWDIAQAMYADRSLRSLSLFFKTADAAQLKDPGAQLQQVLTFKKAIEDGKKHLFKHFDQPPDFATTLDGLLAQWGRVHRNDTAGLSTSGAPEPPPVSAPPPASAATLPFAFWMNELAPTLRENTKTFDPRGALFFADRALAAARDDIEAATAERSKGLAQLHLSNPQDAILLWDHALQRLAGSTTPRAREQAAWAMLHKGVTLGTLERGDEAIAVFDDLLARFGTAPESTLRAQVAAALFRKGVTLGTLERGDEAIAIFDDLLTRFGTATEPTLRAHVAAALVNKGYRLGTLGRNEEEFASYDDLLARFAAATEPPIVTMVANVRALRK